MASVSPSVRPPTAQLTIYAHAVLWAIAMVVLISGLMVWKMRRHLFPLKGRGVEKILLTLFFTAWWASLPMFPLNCAWWHGLHAFTINMAAYINVSRIWCLLFQFKQQDVLGRIHNARKGPLATKEAAMREMSNWFVVNRCFQTTKYLVFGGILFEFPLLVGFLVVVPHCSLEFGRTPVEEVDETDLTYVIAYFFMYVVWAALVCMVGIVMACKMRGFAADNYGLKRELVVLGSLVLTFAALFVAVTFLIPNNRLIRLLFSPIAIFYTIVLMSVWFPIWLSYVHERAPEAAKLIEALQLQSVTDYSLDFFLHCPVNEAAFQKFLMAEFSAENLQFWKAAGEFISHLLEPSNTTPGPTKQQDARHTRLLSPADQATFVALVRGYLQKGAEFEVNLPAKARVAFEPYMLAARIEELTVKECVEMFEFARAEAYLLMMNDTWPRFQRSHHYLTLLRDRADKRQKRLTLIEEDLSESGRISMQPFISAADRSISEKNAGSTIAFFSKGTEPQHSSL